MKLKVLLIQDGDDGGYSAVVPALPGCVTQGDTIEEVLEQAREAATGWLEAQSMRGEQEETESVTLVKEIEL